MAGVARIDEGQQGSPHFVRVLILCVLVAMLDGYDTQAIAFVTPVLGPAWGVDKAGFGPVFAAALFGLMVGSTLFGAAADRWGRKPVICISSAIFGTFALLTPLASNLTELAIWRFLTGIGLGAAIPNLIALTAEHAPGHRRALATGVMFCGFPLGALLCGLAAPTVINGYGWEWIFVAGGILPLLLTPILIWALVESPVWLNRNTEQATSLVPVKDLFANGYAPVTTLLWLGFFASLLVMYFLINWMPSIFTDAGRSLEQATRTTVLLNIGGIVGGFLVTPMIDRFGALKVLPIVFGIAAVAVLMIGRLIPGSTAMFAAIFLAGVGVIGGQLGGNAFAASVYPTTLRASGVGWALSFGRIGSVIGPVLGGILLASGMATSGLFAIAAVITVIPAIMFILIGKLWRG